MFGKLWWINCSPQIVCCINNGIWIVPSAATTVDTNFLVVLSKAICSRASHLLPAQPHKQWKWVYVVEFQITIQKFQNIFPLMCALRNKHSNTESPFRASYLVRLVTIMHNHHHRRRHHHCLQRSQLQTWVVELWSRYPRRWQLWSYNEVLFWWW